MYGSNVRVDAGGHVRGGGFAAGGGGGTDPDRRARTTRLMSNVAASATTFNRSVSTPDLLPGSDPPGNTCRRWLFHGGGGGRSPRAELHRSLYVVWRITNARILPGTTARPPTVPRRSSFAYKYSGVRRVSPDRLTTRRTTATQSPPSPARKRGSDTRDGLTSSMINGAQAESVRTSRASVSNATRVPCRVAQPSSV